jgi:hypothetical protein
MTKRKVIAGLDDFGKCLQAGNVQISSFSERFAEEGRAISLGSFVGYENDYLKISPGIMY